MNPHHAKKLWAPLVTAADTACRTFNALHKDYHAEVCETYRSKDEQAKRYADGRSRVRAGFSLHNYFPAYAFDISISEGGLIPIRDERLYAVFAEIMRDVAPWVEWGGERQMNMAHFEIRGYHPNAARSRVMPTFT